MVGNTYLMALRQSCPSSVKKTRSESSRKDFGGRIIVRITAILRREGARWSCQITFGALQMRADQAICWEEYWTERRSARLFS